MTMIHTILVVTINNYLGHYSNIYYESVKYFQLTVRDSNMANISMLCHICGESKPSETHDMICDGRFTYNCSICDKTFMKKKYLQQHQLIHKDIKVQCPQCKKEMKQESLYRHIRRSHNPVSNVWKCDVCDAEFRKDL